MALALWVGGSAGAQTLVGQVVGIADGDTLTLLVGQVPHVIRLQAIDAPEKGQPFGRAARDALAAICFRKTATALVASQDRYGREVALVVCDQTAANDAMVRQGFAWVYRQYAKGQGGLYEAEDEARTALRGLWADRDPVPPWTWRKTAKAN